MNANPKPTVRAIERAEIRAIQADIRTARAKSRAESAETRAEHAEAILKKIARTPAGEPPPKAGPPNAHPDRRALEQLTIRQREILQLIAAGQNTKQMAAHLQISPKTVEYHRLRLMSALKVHDIPGLVRFALRIGLGPSDD